MISSIWQPNIQAYRPLICDFIAFLNKRHGDLNLSEDDFQRLHEFSVSRLEDFWDGFWDFSGIIGDKGGSVLSPIKLPPYTRFFADGKLSYAENMLSYWIDNPSKTAMIYRHQDQDDHIFTGQDLCDQVSLWTQYLRKQGIKKGDVVAVYLPNIPQSDFIFLACSMIGAVFCSAGMEMGGDDLIGRFAAAEPKLLITARGYQYGDRIIDRTEILERVKAAMPSLCDIVHLSVPAFEADSDVLCDFVPKELSFERFDFNHPLYILFSSGSTGVPKCFVHSSGGVLLKHLSEYLLQADIRRGDVAFYHATPSWMMWNWASSVFAVGATMLKYSGHPFYPDAGAQLRFTAKYGCTHHGTAAPVIMGWKDQGLDVVTGKNALDMRELRSVLYTGAVLPEQGFSYVQTAIKSGVHISGISGGTDLVGCFVYGNPLTPVYAGQIAGATLGLDVQIWDEQGNRLAAGQAGELVCVNPFPSMPLYFLNDADGARYFDAYYAFYDDLGRRVWRHGDSLQITEQGQFVILGRSDGTLNQNGVRIGSIVLYNQLEAFKDYIRGFTAVDFIRPDTKQSVTVLFLAIDDYEEGLSDDLIKGIRKAIKDNVGPYSVPVEIIAVPDVLRTKNGKLAEVVTKKILAGEKILNPKLYGVDLVAFYEDISVQLYDKYKA